MYIPLSDDKHQMVRDSSENRTGQHVWHTYAHMPSIYAHQIFSDSDL